MNIPLKRGKVIRHEGRLYIVADFQERHTGKQRPTVHVALRDVRDGRPVDRTLDDLEPIQEVEHGYRTMQYLYAGGERRIFMDSETFEECELSSVHLHGCEPFLVEGGEYRVMFVDGQPLSLEMPDIVTLRVTMTAAPGHSAGAASNVTKEATLENGLEVRVPLFIKTGDLIRVDTRTKTYTGKEREG
jgi:elongation factor P